MHILWFYNAIHEYTPLRFLGFSVKFQRDHLLPLLLDSPYTPLLGGESSVPAEAGGRKSGQLRVLFQSLEG